MEEFIAPTQQGLITVLGLPEVCYKHWTAQILKNTPSNITFKLLLKPKANLLHISYYLK